MTDAIYESEPFICGLDRRNRLETKDSNKQSSVYEQQESFDWAGGAAKVSMNSKECRCTVSPLEYSSVKSSKAVWGAARHVCHGGGGRDYW